MTEMVWNKDLIRLRAYRRKTGHRLDPVLMKLRRSCILFEENTVKLFFQVCSKIWSAQNFKKLQTSLWNPLSHTMFKNRHWVFEQGSVPGHRAKST